MLVGADKLLLLTNYQIYKGLPQFLITYTRQPFFTEPTQIALNTDNGMNFPA